MKRKHIVGAILIFILNAWPQNMGFKIKGDVWWFGVPMFWMQIFYNGADDARYHFFFSFFGLLADVGIWILLSIILFYLSRKINLLFFQKNN